MSGEKVRTGEPPWWKSGVYETDYSDYAKSENNDGICPVCQENPVYGDQFCSDACKNSFIMLKNQEEFLLSLKALPESERLAKLQEAMNPDGLMHSYVKPLIPENLVVGDKHD